ncbi:MAG TPA: 30S ribosomal protein S20, partial [Myxococcota bacterium]
MAAGDEARACRALAALRRALYVSRPFEARRDALANHKSAAKRARQDARRRERNRSIRARTRTVLKSVRQDLEAGAGDLVARVREAEAALRRAASKGVIPKRRASRLVARLARRANR